MGSPSVLTEERTPDHFGFVPKSVNMPINSNHVTGFVVGLGAAAVSFYLYKRNQAKVDQWLGSKGIHVPHSNVNNTRDDLD